MSKYNEAIESYRRAIILRPDYAAAYFNLGLLYLAAKNKEGALEQQRMLWALDQKLAGEFFHIMYKDKVINVTPK